MAAVPNVVVIGTYSLEKRKRVFEECLATIPDSPLYDKVVVINGGENLPIQGVTVLHNQENLYEIGAIKRVYDNTDYKEIFFLHDTCHVKDPSLFNVLFETYKGKSVTMQRDFLMFIAKYRREVLDRCHIPVVHDKMDSFIHAEIAFNREYMSLEPEYVLLTPDFDDAQAVEEEKWGRRNLRLESQYLVKWKGHWNPGMLRTPHDAV